MEKENNFKKQNQPNQFVDTFVLAFWLNMTLYYVQANQPKFEITIKPAQFVILC